MKRNEKFEYLIDLSDGHFDEFLLFQVQILDNRLQLFLVRAANSILLHQIVILKNTKKVQRNEQFWIESFKKMKTKSLKIPTEKIYLALDVLEVEVGFTAQLSLQHVASFAAFLQFGPQGRQIHAVHFVRGLRGAEFIVFVKQPRILLEHFLVQLQQSDAFKWSVQQNVTASVMIDHPFVSNYY